MNAKQRARAQKVLDGLLSNLDRTPVDNKDVFGYDSYKYLGEKKNGLLHYGVMFSTVDERKIFIKYWTDRPAKCVRHIFRNSSKIEDVLKFDEIEMRFKKRRF